MKTAVFVLVFVSCVSASAFAQFRVNSERDAIDISATDRMCSTGMTIGGEPECTLRAAVMEANRRGGALISLPSGTYVLTLGTEPGDPSGETEDILQDAGVPALIALRTRDLDVEGALFIVGEGPETTIIDGNGSDRVFHITSRSLGDQEFANLTIRNGRVRGRPGGCVSRQQSRGVLSFGNVVLEGCVAEESVGGALFNRGAVIMARSVVRSSRAWHGGGIFNQGFLQVSESSFRGNTGQSFGTVEGRGGAIYHASRGGEPPLLRLWYSALVHNVAVVGGGLYIEGEAGISNSTISSNRAARGGGILAAHVPGTEVGVSSSTIVNNIGEGLRRETSRPLRVGRTIVAANAHPNGELANCAGRMFSTGDMIEDADTCGFNADGDTPNTDPMIGPLGLNGGLTETHPLLEGSPAIDGTRVTAEGTDQRGFPRPIFDSHDIGAYEFGMDDLSLAIIVPIRWSDLFRTPLPASPAGYSVTLSLGSTRSSRAYVGIPHFTNIKPAEGQGQLKVALDPSGRIMHVSGIAVPPKQGEKAKLAATDQTILFYVDIQRPVKGQAALRIRDVQCACNAKPAKPSRIALPRVQRPDKK